MKKFEDIVIVTDLDGTFLNDRESVVQRNVKAIEYFKANGGHFTVATGRVAQHAMGAVPTLAELVNMPMITCNGCCVYDVQNARVCQLYPMDHALAAEIVELIHKDFPTVGIRAGGNDFCFLCTPQDAEHAMIAEDYKKYKGQRCLVEPLEEWKNIPILKLVLRGECDTLDVTLPMLRERFGERINASKSWSTIIDIMPSGMSKGVPFEGYIKKTMPAGTKIYACGDYTNDTEMLLAADVAVCPSNAHPEIKAISDMCLCSNNEGLIAALIEEIEKSKE